MKRLLDLVTGLYAVAAYCFIYLPIVVLVLFSFQASRFPLPPFTGPSLRWYGEVLADSKFTGAMLNSVLVGFISSAASVLLGFLSAYGCARMKGRFGGWVRALLIAPLSVSYLIIGMGLVVLFNWAGVPKSLFAVGIGHVVINLPLCFAILFSQMSDNIIRLEQAARDLGAREWQVLALVVAPVLWPALLASFVLSLTLSWDEFLIAFLLTRFETTLPVEIWTLLRSGLNPKANAIGALVFGVSILLVVLAELAIFGKGKKKA
jgi:spermidine/putrescine transport system permease protein